MKGCSMADYQSDVSRSFDGVHEDALLLHEFCHRTANEIAAASAAVHLAKNSAPGAGSRLLKHAADRLDAFAELHRALARPIRARTNVARDLTVVCRAIASGASGASRSTVSLDVPETWVDGHTARRLVLVGAELVTNAVRHALEGRAGRLEVSLYVISEDIVLQVMDDGPGMRAGATTSRTGLGTGIIAQLVERASGTVAIDSGPSGTTVRVSLPLNSRLDRDEDVGF